MAELVKEDDEKQGETFEDVPGKRRINPTPGVNLVERDQKPGPMEKDFNAKAFEEAE